MNDEQQALTGERGADAWSVDEFYVRRVNWLVAVGRADLIDEIADDCERRRTTRTASGPQLAAQAAP